MDSELILVVDDDPDILRILRDSLELDGYRVATAETGRQAMELFENLAPDLIVLDLSLPDIDGLRICRSIRDGSEVPIIMLTARDRVPDKVLGFESGADDYLVKPFEYLELEARIKARLRRRAPLMETSRVLVRGDLKIDPNTMTVLKRGKPVSLTVREFNLLQFLAANPGKALSRSAIREALWPKGDLYKGSRAIDVHIQHLRSKLEDDPSDCVFIKTVPGVGYMFSETEA